MYSPEFKAETTALIEKPASQIAADLGVNKSILHKRAQKAYEAVGVSQAWPTEGRGTVPTAEGEQDAAKCQ
ncbi:MAG: transposase [Treponema sp.]|nr:transposase [Treponema sp.]